MLFLKRMKISVSGVFGFSIVSIVLLLVIFGPHISPYGPDKQDLNRRMVPPSWYKDGSSEHWLGTDMLGRDVWSRLLWGARTSLVDALLSSLIALSIGVSLGLVSGYYGGLSETIIMRIVDIMLSIPTIMLAIVVVAIMGPNSISVILALGLTMWSEYASVIRSRILILKEEPFVLAARILGASNGESF